MQALVGWLDGTDADDGFAHAIKRAAGLGGIGTKTEIGEFVEGNCLRVDVDDGMFGEFGEIGI